MQIKLSVGYENFINLMFMDRCIIQGDSVGRGPKLLSICGTQANASHWTSSLYRGGVHDVFHRSRYVYINFQVIISVT